MILLHTVPLLLRNDNEVLGSKSLFRLMIMAVSLNIPWNWWKDLSWNRKCVIKLMAKEDINFSYALIVCWQQQTNTFHENDTIIKPNGCPNENPKACKLWTHSGVCNKIRVNWVKIKTLLKTETDDFLRIKSSAAFDITHKLTSTNGLLFS